MVSVVEDFSSHHGLTIAIISDTHGEVDPRIIDRVKSCDLVLHAGDIMGAAVLDCLKPRLRKVIAIKGNNDIYGIWSQTELAILDSMPETVEIDLPGGRLIMEHGDRIHDERLPHDLLRKQYPEAKLVVYGHTHISCIDQSQQPWIMNPGAAGRIRTKGGPSYVELVASQENWRLTSHKFEPLQIAKAV